MTAFASSNGFESRAEKSKSSEGACEITRKKAKPQMPKLTKKAISLLLVASTIVAAINPSRKQASHR